MKVRDQGTELPRRWADCGQTQTEVIWGALTILTAQENHEGAFREQGGKGAMQVCS